MFSHVQWGAPGVCNALSGAKRLILQVELSDEIWGIARYNVGVLCTVGDWE